MNDQLTFLLNGVREDVADAPPTMTLLNYLRRKKRLTGTKEGCAEGDCGACTVAVGELTSTGIRYQPLNACIQLLPMLHGKAIVTVEGLTGPDGELHPAQQAIVDHHGSQCGFCTPGFVMSLYALGANTGSANRCQINEALAGNLCRCTGYGPLIKAAEAATRSANPEWDRDRSTKEHQQLVAISPCKVVDNGEQNALRPDTMDELADLLENNPDAVIIAGATDVGLWVTKQMRQLPLTIHIGQIAELRSVRQEGGKLWIGAAATYADVESALSEHFPDFGALVRRIGGVQVRAAGTIGGNIANGSPIGDTPPALIALGAVLVLRKGTSQRRIPLEEFFLAYGKQDRSPGEFIEGIEIELLDNPTQLRCYKVSKRFDQDISALCGCFNLQLETGIVVDARIAFGGMAGTPLRAKAVEDALRGKPWSEATIDSAVPAFELDFQPISDARASAGYRLTAAKNLLRKYFAESKDSSTQTRIDPTKAVSQ